MKHIARNKEVDETSDEKLKGSESNIWKKVYAHIDAGSVKEKVVKSGKDVKKDDGGRDKSRMKALLIALKNDPQSPGNSLNVDAGIV